MVLRGVFRIRVIVLIIGIAIRVAESVGSPEAIVIHVQVLHVELGNLADETGISRRRNIRCLTVTLWLIMNRRLLSFDTLSATFSLDLHVAILTDSTIPPLFQVESVALESIR